VEALMSRVVNPKSEMCKHGEELTLMYAVTKLDASMPDEASMIKQMDTNFFLPLLETHFEDPLEIPVSYGHETVDRYWIARANVSLLSCVFNDELGDNPRTNLSFVDEMS
jgi:hypothetical protein